MNEFVEKLNKYFGNRTTHELVGNSIRYELDNREGDMCFGDIWEILAHCNYDSLYFNISTDLTTTKKLVFDLACQ